MKKFAWILISVLLLASCNQSGFKITIVVKNPTALDRPDEPVTISRDRLVSLAGKPLPENKVPVLKDENRQTITSQADDLDKDGKWDELFFLIDLAPSSEKKVGVSFVEKGKVPGYTPRSNVRFAAMDSVHTELDHARRLRSTDSPSTQKAFQMEGPAWENDNVAFRNYYDARNGMDIFGKRIKNMVLDSVGLTPHSYHKLAAWGMDILKVGNSLGAGAIALKKGGHLYRLDLPEEGTYKLIVDGPLLSIFELGFKNLKIEGNNYNIIHRILIWGGTHFYKSKVSVSGLTGDETLVTGIVKHCDSLIIEEPNDKYILLATHCNQAYNGEKLGMGLLVKSNGYIASMEVPKSGSIVNTYLTELSISENKAVEFYFFSGWELQDKGFKSVDYFIKTITDEATRLVNPIEIESSPN